MSCSTHSSKTQKNTAPMMGISSKQFQTHYKIPKTWYLKKKQRNLLISRTERFYCSWCFVQQWLIFAWSSYGGHVQDTIFPWKFWGFFGVRRSECGKKHIWRKFLLIFDEKSMGRGRIFTLHENHKEVMHSCRWINQIWILWVHPKASGKLTLRSSICGSSILELAALK